MIIRMIKGKTYRLRCIQRRRLKNTQAYTEVSFPHWSYAERSILRIVP